MRRLVRTLALVTAVAALTAPPAAADHPAAPVPSTPGASAASALVKAPPGGTWTFVENVPNPGTDAEFFVRDGVTYGVFGTFLQSPGTNAGFRVLQLARDTTVNTDTVRWVGDHTSANCQPPATSQATGIQHDVQVTPLTPDQARSLRTVVAQLVIDSNDAPGRCHDPLGKGGIEIVDISDPTKPLELAMVRLYGEAHNATVDRDRPWIVYASSADPPGSAFVPGRTTIENYIDIVNIRSCFGPRQGARERCQPVVHRFQFDDAWTVGSGASPNGLHTVPYACHDITYAAQRLYCAAINSTVILDVSGAFDARGDLKGSPLPCDVLTTASSTHPAGGTNPAHPGARVTGARIVDCNARASKAQWSALPVPRPQATGIRMVGVARHAGRDPSAGVPNSEVLKDISISHEADPTPDGRTMFVTDERGGGLLIPAASCSPGATSQFSNGGIHAYDISDPARPRPRETPDGRRAVFVAPPLIAAPTFCNVHVLEQVPDENRLFVAWYTQGTRVVDFEVRPDGRITFTEVAYWLPPGADQWVAKPFLVTDAPDGSRTYHLAVNNITRGIDVVSFRARPNLIVPDGPRDGAGATAAAAGPPPGDELPATGGTRWPAVAAAVAAVALALGARRIRPGSSGR